MKILLRVPNLVQLCIPCISILVFFFPLVVTSSRLLKDISVTKTFQTTEVLHFSNMNTLQRAILMSYVLAQIYQYMKTLKISTLSLLLTQNLEMGKREKFDNPQTMFTFGIQDLEICKTRKE